MTKPGPEKNPLLHQGELPDFEAIEAGQVMPAVQSVLDRAEQILAELEALNVPTWENFVLPLREISRSLEHVWGVVNHLMGVKNSAELRAQHEEAQPLIVDFSIKLSQSEKLYRHWKALSDDASQLTSPARRRIAEASVRDAQLSGVDLKGEAKERFNEISRRLAVITTNFSNNVLDATKSFKLLLKDKTRVEGLPASWLKMAAHLAREEGNQNANEQNGPWLVTLDMPVYLPVLQHATDRALRETLYKANIIRASGTDYSKEYNNWPIIDEILTLRKEQSQILGFQNYAQVSLASKMAPTTIEVRAMIEQLFGASKAAAVNDLEQLKLFARETGFQNDLQLWDITYFSERRREALYDFTDEQLRPYFPLPKVMSGMFSLAAHLFDVRIEASKEPVKLWHKDVQFYDIYDSSDRKIAAFYLDPYARSGEKRGGAWMDVCRQRESLNGQVTLPVAYLVCNGTPPVDDRPSLMTFSEVETLFHEFGHGLQHMLTRVEEYEASGISNVEWDAVELPSQFMENWVYERFVMDDISGHFETGEKLPDDLFKKIIAAKNYMSGSMMLRQLYFSLLDLELHENYNAGDDVRAIQRRIAKDYTVMNPLDEDAFLCSFGHIFAGGYAAGYYSYKWAEVLSADAFAAFEEAGLQNAKAVRDLGIKYRDSVLSLGGAKHPSEVYREFRGRDATIEALLRHSGLVEN